MRGLPGSRSSEAVGSASTAASCVAMPHTSSAKSVGLNRSILSCARFGDHGRAQPPRRRRRIDRRRRRRRRRRGPDGGVYGVARARRWRRVSGEFFPAAVDGHALCSRMPPTSSKRAPPAMLGGFLCVGQRMGLVEAQRAYRDGQSNLKSLCSRPKSCAIRRSRGGRGRRSGRRPRSTVPITYTASARTPVGVAPAQPRSGVVWTDDFARQRAAGVPLWNAIVNPGRGDGAALRPRRSDRRQQLRLRHHRRREAPRDVREVRGLDRAHEA